MPCARGETNFDGEYCPYIANAPKTLEGHEAWDIIQKCSTQLRIMPSGKVLGFDLPAIIMAIETMGYHKQALLSLISAAEAGMLQGIRKLYDDP